MSTPDRRSLDLAVAALSIGLLAASCGTGEPAAAPGDPEDSTRGEETTTTAVDRSPDLGDEPVARLPYDAGELSPTSTPRERPTTTTTAEVTTTTSGQPASTSGSGGAPVTTVGGGSGGDVAIYQGILGNLGRDDQVVPPVAPAPSVGPGILPLTGLPGVVPNRPTAVVKIDNGSRARPQTGLNAADIVVEEEVEGGITRFAAIFHSTPSIVGPVRSGRTTDIGIINGFGQPLLLYSGANEVTDALLRAQPTVQNRSAGTSSGYWRSSSRSAPSNLYTDTAPHWPRPMGVRPLPSSSTGPMAARSVGCLTMP